MKKIVKTLMILLLISFTSGCVKEEPCVPITKMTKPVRVNIASAKVEQCTYKTTLKNVKCVMKNYVNMKTERDQIKDAYEKVTK